MNPVYEIPIKSQLVRLGKIYCLKPYLIVVGQLYSLGQWNMIRLMINSPTNLCYNTSRGNTGYLADILGSIPFAQSISSNEFKLGDLSEFVHR